MFIENGEKVLSKIIDNTGNYNTTNKNTYTIQVYKPKIGTSIYNFLEKSSYFTTEERPFVMIGQKGEEWIVEANILVKRYTINGKDINEFFLDYISSEPVNITTKPIQSWAMQIPKDISFKLSTAWGDSLVINDELKDGDFPDFIVCTDNYGAPNLNDRWVVDGNVFKETYSLLNIPKLDDVSYLKDFKNI